MSPVFAASRRAARAPAPTLPVMQTRLIELAIQLTRPFETAAGRIEQRRTVLVGITEDGTTGWGEAAPYPGMTTDTIDGVWARPWRVRRPIWPLVSALSRCGKPSGGLPGR